MRTNFKEQTRYGTYVYFTYVENEHYWDIDCHECYYASLHYDPNDNQQIVGVDPEGFYIIGIGSEIEGTIITRIEDVTSENKKLKFKAYIN